MFYDKNLITKQIKEYAFDVSKKLNLQSMGFDFVVDKNTGKGYIVEMCYGFSNESLLEANGYWDLNDNWVNKPLNASKEILKNLID